MPIRGVNNILREKLNLNLESNPCSRTINALSTIDRSWRDMEIYKWKWVVLGALACMNNEDNGKY